MKKKLFTLLVISLLLFSLTACTPAMNSYLEASTKVSEWKGASVKGSMDIGVSSLDESIKMEAEFSGKSIGQDKAEVDISFKPTMIEGKEFKFPDFKVFVNGQKMYFNKSALVAIMENSGEKVSKELQDIKEEYISLDNASMINNQNMSSQKTIDYLNSAEFKKDVMELYNVSLKDFKPSVDMVVKDNNFKYDANIENIVDDSIQAVNLIITNWAETTKVLVPMLEKMDVKVTVEQLNELIKTYNKEEVEKSANDVKAQLAGSKISIDDTFKDDSYESKVGMTIKVKELMDMSMNVHTVTTKDENVAITFPTSVKSITFEEYLKLFGADLSVHPIEIQLKGEVVECDIPPMIINNRTLVPCRAVFEKMGATVEWNEENKTIIVTKDKDVIVFTVDSNKATVNGKEVELDQAASILGDRTLIPLRFVGENLGFKIGFEAKADGTYLVTID